MPIPASLSSRRYLSSYDIRCDKTARASAGPTAEYTRSKSHRQPQEIEITTPNNNHQAHPSFHHPQGPTPNMHPTQQATNHATDTWLLDTAEVSAVGLPGRNSTVTDRLSQALAVCHRVDAAFPSHEVTTIEANILCTHVDMAIESNGL